MGVVQHQDGDGVGRCGARAFDAISGDPGGRSLRQHQGFVADIGGGVDGRIDTNRAFELAAVTARQGGGLDPPIPQQA